jgi:hypothetical protein
MIAKIYIFHKTGNAPKRVSQTLSLFILKHGISKSDLGRMASSLTEQIRKWSKIQTLSIVQGSTPLKTNKEEQAPPKVLAITIQ